MGRSERDYLRMIAGLRDAWGPLPDEGVESHLFVDRGSVLKVYRWFLFRTLSAARERSVRRRQQALLELYAPALHGRVVAITRDGRLVAPAAPQAFAYGLRMRQGAPFLRCVWDGAGDRERRAWLGKIGAAVAACHRRAPRIPSGLYHRPSVPLEWLRYLWAMIQRHRRRLAVGGPDWPTIVHRATAMPGLRYATETGRVPMVHGDLNLENIVVYEGELQLIDPGYALPFGVGLPMAAGTAFDTPWDLTALLASCAWHGGPRHQRALLEGYRQASGEDWTGLTRRVPFWNVLFGLMVTAVCLRRWRELRDPTSAFARRLREGGTSLARYARHSFARALAPLDLVEPYPRLRAALEAGPGRASLPPAR
jgi:hypothetical protein